MKRRDLLIAASGVAASLGLGAAWAKEEGVRPAPSSAPPTIKPDTTAQGLCAIHPISSRRGLGSGIRALTIEALFPSEALGTLSLSVWSLDLRLRDITGQERLVYLWQMQRQGSRVSASQRVTMPFEDMALEVVGTMRQGSLRAPDQTWVQSLPVGSQFLVVSPRASTALPPSLTELRFQPESMRLWMADGSPRDFDAVLMQTS